MNSLFVPQLGGQIYAMAGMETKLHLQADHPGSYRGLSAHYSGKGFMGMTFRMDAVSPQAFSGWVAGAKRNGPLLDRAGYLALLKDSQNVTPYTYRAVLPGLFDAVVKDSGTASANRAKEGRQQ